MDVLPKKKHGVIAEFHRVKEVLKSRWADDKFNGFAGHGLKSVLIFLCFKGGVDESGTQLHLDFTPAINAAFAMSLDHVTARTILALWLFIRPCSLAIKRINLCIMTKGSSALKALLPNGFVLPALRHNGKFVLGGKLGQAAICALNMQLSKLNEAMMRELHSICGPFVELREQRHGDVIQLMSGWAHAVHTLHACWKLAFDFIKINMLPEIAFMQKMRGVQLIGQRGAEDYAMPHHVAVDEIMYMLGIYA
jgi:hypothetical protein